MQEQQTETIITPDLLRQAMSYPQYMDLLESEMAQGRTTGTDQSPWLVDYARLNLQRMRRLNKTTVLIDEFRQALDRLEKPQLWVVITEGWCGDAAQIVPVMAKVAEYSSKIGLKLLLRDEHPAVMDAYLTNGTRSIPKLIALEPQHLGELGSWGPRPRPHRRWSWTLRPTPTAARRKSLCSWCTSGMPIIKRWIPRKNCCKACCSGMQKQKKEPNKLLFYEG
ncbi:thioredoxin family protein [Cesiribacter andamanensis]|uniref:Thioredoxin n=1 Tax=Cesiribacter andamanensis AMV16 TaxID=1279009 RepID=M7NAE3_9BACT|nr:thioredoxin family protein [Cesiribacter andamanensis]EMR04222.1 hypothetical protein ADICEAN_00630 [Cesiribacter andamanensis AMV16]